MSKYILVVSDGSLTALEKVKIWDKSGKWPIFSSTHNKNKLKPDDEFLVYIAGKGVSSGCFIAHFKAINIEWPLQEKQLSLLTIKKTQSIHTKVCFDEICYLEPIKLDKIKKHLDFIKNNNISTGAYLRGGCKYISECDYLYVLNNTSKYDYRD